MARQNRKILMFIDNCPSHPQQGLNFSNMKVVYLPPYSTSVTQRMDAGVIKCLKGYYRVSLARKFCSMLESNEIITSNSIKLYEAIEMLVHSWNSSVSKETISNCFSLAIFFAQRFDQNRQYQIW